MREEERDAQNNMLEWEKSGWMCTMFWTALNSLEWKNWKCCVQRYGTRNSETWWKFPETFCTILLYSEAAFGSNLLWNGDSVWSHDSRTSRNPAEEWATIYSTENSNLAEQRVDLKRKYRNNYSVWKIQSEKFSLKNSVRKNSVTKIQSEKFHHMNKMRSTCG